MTEETTIIRAPRSADHPYFCMSRDLAQDSRLTLEERGLLAYLLSKPDDWEIRLSDLQREGKWGSQKTKTIVSRLVKFGYFQKEQTREVTPNKKTLFGPTFIRVIECPQKPVFQSVDFQSAEIQTTDFQSAEKSQHTKYIESDSDSFSTIQDSESKEESQSTESKQCAEKSAQVDAEIMSPSSLTNDIETPKKRANKKSPRPPAEKKPRPRNWRFEAIALCGWDIKPGGPYGKSTSGRVGKVLRELDESFEPPLDAQDIVNAYKHNKMQDKIAPRDPVAVVSMVHTWINAGRPNYKPQNGNGVKESFTPSPVPPMPEPKVDYRGYPIGLTGELQ